jgi:hypothetical protein
LGKFLHRRSGPSAGERRVTPGPHRDLDFTDLAALTQLPARAGDFAAGWTCRSD